jgi:GTP-binding protein HflX
MLTKDTFEKINKRAILVGICLNNNETQKVKNSLAELKRLADTAEFETVDIVYQNRKSHDKAYFLGKGYIQALKERMKEEDIPFLIFDDELSPSQHSHLEKDFEIKVVDRTEMILNIFYMHAQTAEARLQIRLAELKYELPRLKQMWTDYDRIGSSAFGGAGFASRGSGEKQTDLDRLKIRQEIYQINEKLNKIMIQKKTQSKRREMINRICLVGYTNAGKSTLFNNLTKSDVLVEDKLFATLDSTTRPLIRLQEENFVLADTVGFIAKLPHNLVASFRATLKEAKEANLLLLVVDASDPNFKDQIMEVNKVLKDIKIDDIPVLMVFNKIDQISPQELLLLSNFYKDAVFISAKDDKNVETLLKSIEKFFLQKKDYKLMLPYCEQKLLAQLYKIGIVKNIDHKENGISVLVHLDINYFNLISSFIED